LKFLLIPTTSRTEVISGLSFDQSNIFREMAYNYIVQTILNGTFESNFNDISSYGKRSKKDKETPENSE